MLLISLSFVFYSKINYAVENFLFNKFNIVSQKDNLLVHFIDVGQGDAIAINLPNNEVMVIDAGPKKNNVKLTNYIKENVLGAKNNSRIDYLVLTHADADHIGGALLLLNEFDVGKVYLPKVSADTKTYIELEEYVNENESYEVVTALTSFDVKETKINILGLYNYNDTNNSSAVVKLEFKNKSFLFTADITAEVENQLIEDYGEMLNADVLKVAHHGSKYSTSKNFVDVVTPEYSIISVGENSYGHPVQDVLNNLYKSEVVRTDVDGNILFAVGKHYNLLCNVDDCLIVKIAFDYRFYILVIDAIIVCCVVVILIKKEKHKNKHR